jgi:hypothetical protein
MLEENKSLCSIRVQYYENFEKSPLLPDLPPSPKAMAGQAASDSNSNPRNTQGNPVVRIFAFLDLE